jgi:hypothetical protein
MDAKKRAAQRNGRRRGVTALSVSSISFLVFLAAVSGFFLPPEEDRHA